MKVAYDNKSFMLDGRRIWIVGGEIHYFRHPRQEWREVLLRAKRAGLNTICTYVPWNFHEVTEGAVDFEGDKDLAAYIDLIGELGMYAMLRPGPYICSEWDGGGLPAWLCAKPVLRFREDDPVYMAAVERWFDQLLPIISERQITKGGPVLTVQNENEYPGGWDASMRRYIDKLGRMFRKSGIDVPIVACNVHGESDTTCKINNSTVASDQIIDPDMILTYNHHVVVEPVKHLQSKQPNSPLITTEFWTGSPIYWGSTVTDWPDKLELARAAYEFASYGTQIVYYMFEGGTNFAFWGGTNIATSYASGYPVGEGGLLTPKYYAVKPVNLFTGTFGDLIAESGERTDTSDYGRAEGVRLVVRDSSQGAMLFVSVHDDRRESSLILPGGKELTVHYGEVQAAVLPHRLEALAGVTLDYSNLCLLARDEASRMIALYGPAGSEGVFSVNGQEFGVTVGRRKVERIELDGVRVLIADEEMARRCWLVDGRIVFGPDYAEVTQEDGSLNMKVSGGTPTEIVYLGKDGALASKHCLHVPSEIKLPELGAWQMAPCDEVVAGSGWLPIKEPCSHEKLGIVHGYVWYAAELECLEDGVEKLLLTNAPNRVSVFVNGQYCGTHGEARSARMRDEYEHPAAWAFEELTVQVRRGRNRFVFLSDDLGHNYDVPISTGIQGPVVVGARRVEVASGRDVAPQPVSDDAFYFLYNCDYREQKPLPAVEFELQLEADQQAFIYLHAVHAWVTVNGEDVLPLSFPESPWTMFSQIKRWISWQLPNSSPDRKMTVRVHYTQSNAAQVLESMAVYAAPKSGELSDWQWKAWEGSGDFSASLSVAGTEKEKEGQVLLLPVGGRAQRKGRQLKPAYFRTTFRAPEGERPVYLDIGELQKGHIVLNGQYAGRFWSKGGTQLRYYLPRSWMKEENELILFEELGFYPQDVSLAFGESGSWSSVALHWD